MSGTYVVYAHIVPKEISNYDHDKYYIGITMQEPQKRFKNGHGYEKCTLFWKAIQKYGWKNLTHIILKDSLTLYEARELEKMCIEFFKSNDAIFGYNCTIGGEGVNGYHHTLEIRKEISARQKGRIPSNKGTKASESIKEKQRKAWKKRKSRGSDIGTKKPVIVHPIEKRFDSMKDACDALSLNYASAINVVLGKRKSIFGYSFEYVGGYINSLKEEY